MSDPDTWLSLAAFAAFLVIASGSWVFHSRLRNRRSFYFFSSVMALAVWVPISTGLHLFLMLAPRDANGRISATLNWLYIASSFIVPGLLLLSAAVCFWFAVRTMEPRPNNSFKPKPLRGSA